MSLTLTFVAVSLHFVMTPRLLAILGGGISIQELLVASDVKVNISNIRKKSNLL